jgi:hypothetical protein
MARDPGLEEVLNGELRSVPGITTKPMFGGLAWLLDDHLLCGARQDGMLLRVGKANEVWALKLAGVVPMISRGRRMSGWVRAAPEAYGDDTVRRKLLDAALKFTGSLGCK